MKQFNYVIKDELGLHARPAGLLVKLAKTYPCDITIKKEGKTGDAKKIMSVMSMGVKQGNEVQLICSGDEEAAATAALEAFFRTNL